MANSRNVFTQTQGRRFSRVAAGSALLMLGLGQNALAQSDEPVTRLDAITVEGNRFYEMDASEATGGYGIESATVGTKTPATLRDIPQSVSVVTREAIEDQNLNTLDELGRKTPGMRVLSNDNGRSSIYARGYEYDEYNIDGLPAPMASINGSVPSLSAIDRVEIMRGPSGLFNSTSEMGGIVNLVRKRPTDEFQAHIQGTAGTEDQYGAQMDVAGPLNESGSVRGRVVADRTDHASYVDYNDNKQSDLYAAVDIDLTDNTTLGLGVLRNTKDIVVDNGRPLDSNGDLFYSSQSDFYGAKWNNFESETNDWFAELTHSFAGGGFGRVAARYSDRHANYNYAFGGSALDANQTLGVAGIGAEVDQEALAVDASYSKPFEAFGNVSEFVVGTDFKKYDTDNASTRTRGLASGVTRKELNNLAYVDILQAGRDGTGGFRFSDSTSRLRETGLYAKLTLRPVESLALIAGGRVSRYKVEEIDNTSGDGQDRSDSEVTPYAGLVFDLDRQHSLYASYSQVFKPQTSVDVDGDLLDPREGDQYEVGVKGSYFGGDLNARVSAFRLYDENRAAPVTGESYSEAVGEMRIEGGEVEISGSLTEQWDLIAGYTYMDTDVQEASSARNDGVFLLMPQNQVKLWTQYGFNGGQLHGLRIGGGVTAMSHFEASAGIDAPGYAVVDAMIGYDFSENLSAQLNLNNLLDREYYNRVGGEGTFNMMGAPANAVATVRYDF
ncbi:TonB-dependent siderophore receptor [Marinobacter oulmenensis]|uniref:Outer membrane receptor for ferric coprogen and ferric-rhodotorulic acid n=1 Tax=Marinobacter oulmenensis TaxID=643747 RepID=A0A840UQ83_9GAMM|nr:TonB-dependent siderophore receptor [Marinobacter oulmenensis]MBB5322758.1 outer membrane receptor for ferric coprogen and ferric-rhodotorulic acid [Marinobacter oulmenensis]